MFAHMIQRLLTYGFLAAFFIGLSGCYTVPKTGRFALSMVSEKKLAAASAAEFTNVKIEKAISTDPNHDARVQKIGERIAKVAKDDIPNADWEFVVFEDNQINAFAMPGGKVAVYSGLLKIAETDDELAMVIGHEIAHVAARHSNERFSQQRMKSGLLNVLSLALSIVGVGSLQNQVLVTVVGAGADLGLMLPYSRKHESEADEIGLLYAAEAGYNPYAAITFWERVQSEDEETPPGFLSTHPSSDTRIRKLWAKMPEALEIYRNTQRAAP